MKDKESMTVSEPVAATLSESVRRSGLLSQVMSLSQPDKKALIRYLRKDVEKEDAFQTDEDLKKALDYLKEHGSFDGTATEFCDLIKASKKPQSISGKIWNRRNDLAKLGFSFMRDHRRDATHFTFTKIEPESEKKSEPGCYPFDIVFQDSAGVYHLYGGNKAVTSSQSSQTA